MNDSRFDTLILSITGALIVWVLIRKTTGGNNTQILAPQSAPTDQYNIPQASMWNGSTLPVSAQPAINVNIGNQGLNYLNQTVMPMFGFVGMAQGANYGSPA